MAGGADREQCALEEDGGHKAHRAKLGGLAQLSYDRSYTLSPGSRFGTVVAKNSATPHTSQDDLISSVPSGWGGAPILANHAAKNSFRLLL